jgi:hypothetical protein
MKRQQWFALACLAAMAMVMAHLSGDRLVVKIGTGCAAASCIFVLLVALYPVGSRQRNLVICLAASAGLSALVLTSAQQTYGVECGYPIAIEIVLLIVGVQALDPRVARTG